MGPQPPQDDDAARAEELERALDAARDSRVREVMAEKIERITHGTPEHDAVQREQAALERDIADSAARAERYTDERNGRGRFRGLSLRLRG